MLSLHAATRRTAPARTGRRKSATPAPSSARIGLAIAGGGPIGAMYELGALRALDEALDGVDLTRMDCYVGVSSGAFLAAGLVNRMTTAEMCRIFITGDSDDVRFRPETFLRPAVFEYLRRASALPRLTFDWWASLLSPRESRLSDFMVRFGSVVPTGLFDNSEVERFLREIFSRRGRTNDFRKLERELFVVAVDLDSGEAVRFGGEDWRDIPISKAVQASAALPGLYPPVEVRGRHYVDGALRRTMHASVLLERGVDLLIGINPLVPFDSTKVDSDAGRQGDIDPHRIWQGGLPAVMSQTFRTLLQSRMQVGLAKYAQQYPDIDQLIFEPNANDGEMFFTNAFSFGNRRRLCQLGYRNTLQDLRKRAESLEPVLAAHGIRLRHDILEDRHRTVLTGLGTAPPRSTDTTAKLRRALDETEHLIRKRKRG
ncbi:patatin-like phospholipase family protein [Lysobacter brunescens]|uniref:Patatin-like phospholipase family protein n=1 Tax=Lysobacter brunescens TaxID=262323 RepID=A0ABW2YGT6_9GAMM